MGRAMAAGHGSVPPARGPAGWLGGSGQSWAKGDRHAVGREQREGVGQVPADVTSHWHPGPDLRHPCHFSEPLRQGARHPGVLSQQGGCHPSLDAGEATSGTACSRACLPPRDDPTHLGLFFKWTPSPGTEVWKMLTAAPCALFPPGAD